MNKKTNQKPPPFTMDDGFKKIKEGYFKDPLYREILKIKESNQIDALFECIERLAKEKGGGISTSQIRNIYSKVTKDKSNLKMLRPKLAYVAARNNKVETKAVFAFFEHLIKDIQNDKEADNFHFFMESFVAYHKLYANNK